MIDGIVEAIEDKRANATDVSMAAVDVGITIAVLELSTRDEDARADAAVLKPVEEPADVDEAIDELRLEFTLDMAAT